MKDSSFTGRRAVVIAAAAVVAAALGAPARADIVGPPPDECPDGSLPGSSHCGAYCAPARCTGDDDCDGDATCQELELCIEVLDCLSNGGPFTQEAVSDSCEGGGACGEGTCQAARVCAPTEPETSVQRAGCTCAAAGGREAAGAALAGLIAVAALLAVRRGRSRA